MVESSWLSTGRDRASFSFMVIGIAFVIYWDLTVVTPTYYPRLCLAFILHLVAETSLTLNIAVNLYWVITEARKKRTYDFLQASIQGSRMCKECQRPFPPFSYHCRICNVCSFKRDHHCVFTGTCINFYNLPYFLKTLWFLWLAALYAVIYNFEYTLNNMGENVLAQFLLFICPPIAMMVGKVSAYGFLIIIFELLAVIVMLLVTFLIYIQLTAIMRGQTRYERKHNIALFNISKGWTNNFRATLGTRWYLVWLFPFVPITLPEENTDLKCNASNTHNKIL